MVQRARVWLPWYDADGTEDVVLTPSVPSLLVSLTLGFLCLCLLF